MFPHMRIVIIHWANSPGNRLFWECPWKMTVDFTSVALCNYSLTYTVRHSMTISPIHARAKTRMKTGDDCAASCKRRHFLDFLYFLFLSECTLYLCRVLASNFATDWYSQTTVKYRLQSDVLASPLLVLTVQPLHGHIVLFFLFTAGQHHGHRPLPEQAKKWIIIQLVMFRTEDAGILSSS